MNRDSEITIDLRNLNAQSLLSNLRFSLTWCSSIEVPFSSTDASMLPSRNIFN